MEWKNYEDIFVEKSKNKMEWLFHELNKIRTGKITPMILDDIIVDYESHHSKIIEIANIKSIDARQLVIKPYDNSSLRRIYDSILKSNLGVTPILESETIRLNFPSPTEDSRKLLVKKTKEHAEQIKIGIRNIRKEIHQKIDKDDELTKDDIRFYVESLDKIVKNKNIEIDKIISEKEKDLMTI